jgi:hypothetical protein
MSMHIRQIMLGLEQDLATYESKMTQAIDSFSVFNDDLDEAVAQIKAREIEMATMFLSKKVKAKMIQQMSSDTEMEVKRDEQIRARIIAHTEKMNASYRATLTKTVSMTVSVIKKMNDEIGIILMNMEPKLVKTGNADWDAGNAADADRMAARLGKLYAIRANAYAKADEKMAADMKKVGIEVAMK